VIATDELVKLLAAGAQTLHRTFPVTRKGCGRGSGEAPRALKLILLNRLAGGDPKLRLVEHQGGDSYHVAERHGTSSGPLYVIPFTFRVTTAKRLAETGRPWFNVSAREIEKWKAERRHLIIAECKISETGERVVRVYVVNPDSFVDISRFETKSSELLPSALFEVQHDEEGFYLFNLTAKNAYPKLRIPHNAVVEMNLSPAEKSLLQTAYDDVRERDRTVGGDFEPLVITVDPGTAPPQEIAEYLIEVSRLYSLVGGSGVQFALVDSREPARVIAQ
jgi:hypothetical protein